MTEAKNNEPSLEPSNPVADLDDEIELVRERYSPDKNLAFAALVFISISAASFFCSTILLLAKSGYFQSGGEIVAATKQFTALEEKDIYAFLKWMLENFGDAIIILISGLITAFFGSSLLQASGASSRTVIPDKDYKLLAPLIRDSKETAITQYVRLSSLSGFTGTFTKLGFTGLPLATISLTLVFALLTFFDDKFLDLAKLTLGAFIGSFVQRQSQEDNNKKQDSDSSNIDNLDI